MELPEKLLTTTSFLLSKCAVLITNELDSKMEHLGIRSKHFAILLLLQEKKDVNQREIGNILFIDRNTMVLLVDTLEELNYVKREKSKTDRRAYHILLTEKGREILPQATKIMEEVEDHFLGMIDPEEKKKLNNYLINIISL
ncbi:MAG: MarR family transcriptional regulator [Bacteroidota bacterium]